MKITFKKVISIILALTISVLSFLVTIPSYAAEERFEIYVEEDPVSEYGYQNYRYVDGNGNEILLGSNDNQVFTQSSLPSYYDARDYGYVTNIKYQGTGGNCWAYSSLSTMETNSIIKGYSTSDTTDYSEAHLTWFTGRGLAQDENDLAYGDGHNLESPFYYGGNWVRAAATLARWSGVADESEFPSYPYNFSLMGNYDESERYSTSAGVVLESAQSLQSMSDIKNWIYENGSAVLSFSYDDIYFNEKTFGYYSSEDGTINHMVSIIGWDDNYSADNFVNKPSGKGAWICKNSWSKSWGDKGYFMLSYYDLSIGEVAGFTSMKNDVFYKNYTYNGSDWRYASGARNVPVQVANVFTASGNEKLSAVAVQTVDANNKAKIRIYKNLPKNCTSPVSGTLAAQHETIIERKGYHTIYLNQEVVLEKGEKFAVVVQYENLNSNVTYFPVEYSPAQYQTFSSRAGESYINYSQYDSYWETAESNGFNNVYVQAFTKCNHQIESKTDGLTCTEDGTETVYCKQCGKIESEKTVFHSGHRFSKWSQFAKDSNGEEISIRTCQNCDLTEKRQLAFMNVVTVPDIIEMFFRNIINFIKQLCI